MSESGDTTTEPRSTDADEGADTSPRSPRGEENPESDPGTRGSGEPGANLAGGEEAADPATSVSEGGETRGQAAPHDEVSQEVRRLEAELAELNDRHLRLAAEFDNFRRRSQNQLGETGTRAQAALVSKLLDVLDDFERVMSLDPEQATVESVLEGVQLVEQKLHRVLEDAGLEPIEAEGQDFDPNAMEAMMKEPTDSEEEDDTIARVLQRGFRFKGHLVRPARVSVRKYD